MGVKEMKYNDKNLNVIIEGEEYNIAVTDYIKITNNDKWMFIMRLINTLDYVFYNYIQSFLRKEFGISKSTVNGYLTQLENSGMVKTLYYNSHKIAMLTQKGKKLINNDPSSKVKSPPNFSDLLLKTYIAELMKTRGLCRFVTHVEVLEFYKEVFEIIKGDSNYEIEDYFATNLYINTLSNMSYSKEYFISPMKLSLKENIVNYLIDAPICEKLNYFECQFKRPIFSAKDYIQMQIELIEQYISSSKLERTRLKRDEMSILNNRHIYFYRFDKENRVIHFLTFDLHRPKNYLEKSINKIDKFIGRLHQMMGKIYLRFDVIIITSNERSEIIRNNAKTIVTKIDKQNKKLLKDCSYVGCDEINYDKFKYVRLKYYKAAPYLKAIQIIKLDIDKYFKPNKIKNI